MSFTIRPLAVFSEASAYDDALKVWRDTEVDVRARWHQFLAADGEARRLALAAYVAALDREAAAADDLAALVPVDRVA